MKSFEEIVREMELEEFPVLHKDLWLSQQGLVPILEGNYSHFTPRHHIEAGLMTEEIIEDMKTNKKKMLSVGSGFAYLEVLLTRRFGIDPENITLSDISAEKTPEGFKFYQFDMFEMWPDFDYGFDYILFPECLCGLCYVDHIQWPDESSKIFKNALANLNDSGQARFDGYVYEDLFEDTFKLVESEYPKAELSFYKHTMILKNGK